jgi:hypothetical protein
MDFKNDVGKKVVQILIDSLIYLKKKKLTSRQPTSPKNSTFFFGCKL